MKSSALIKTLLFILSGIITSNVSAAPLNYLPNEILVKYKQNTSTVNIQSTVSALGANVVSSKKINNFQRIIFSSKQDIHQRIEELMQNPNVELAQPNYIYRKAAFPDDTRYNELWGLNNTGQPVNPPVTGTTGTSGSDINAEQAWEYVTDCSAVTVAVLDTGISTIHQDLVTVPGYDFIDNDNVPDDDDGHGTHVAGTIGAVGNNNTGTTGVCWSVNLMPVRVLNAIGVGFTWTIAPGIDYAVANGASIINMSLGGAGLNDTLVNNAILNAQTNDVVIVVAAGNDGADNDASPYYPCNVDSVNSETIENIICVAALDQNYNLAGFSNYGATNVDVGAPGVNILSEVAGVTTTEIADDFSPAAPLPGSWLFDPVDRPWLEEQHSDPLGSYVYTSPLIVVPVDRDMPPRYYLSDPSGFDIMKDPFLGTPVNYEEGIDDTAYLTIDLSTYDVKTIEFEFDFAVAGGTPTSRDYVRMVYDTAGGVPTTVIPGSEYSGTYIGDLFPFGFELPVSCGATCSVGFNLESNTDGLALYGVDISNLLIRGLTKNNSSYAYHQGTSMATPHVAGVAALTKAKNPNYTYQDIVNAVKTSGNSIPALAGTTSTGRAVDAFNAIKYIHPPQGLSVDPSMPIVP